MVMEALFNSIYKGKKVFITGHTGFKGSWLAFWLHKMGSKITGFSLPEKTSPAHIDLLNLDIKTWHGDIRDKAYLQQAIQTSQPDIVFHLAAQALVRDSYREPLLTYETNVIGTLNVLEAVRQTKTVKALVNVTTDKVYHNNEWNWPYREIDPLGGYDMYSSSKACSEILTSSYRNSFFNPDEYGIKHEVLIAAARAGNVIGGGDWAKDRLIPDAVRATASGQTLEIRSPRSIRPWEHVLEPLSGYLLLGQKLLEGQKQYASAWNFGPDALHCLTVSEVLDQFNKQWPEMKWINKEDPSNVHEAKILKLDCSKALGELSWKSVWSLEETLKYTANWYKDFYSKSQLNTEQDLNIYIDKAITQKNTWTIS